MRLSLSLVPLAVAGGTLLAACGSSASGSSTATSQPALAQSPAAPTAAATTAPAATAAASATGGAASAYSVGVLIPSGAPTPSGACPGESTVDIEACDLQKLKTYLGQIDAEAATIDGKADSKTRADLDTAQRAWVAYVKADCTVVADSAGGGTIAGPLYAGCETSAASTRLAELKSQNS